jgi:hypothetical protein
MDSRSLQDLLVFCDNQQYQQEAFLMGNVNALTAALTSRLNMVTSKMALMSDAWSKLTVANDTLSRALLENKDSLSLALDRIIKLENENDECKRVISEYDAQRDYVEESLIHAEREHDELNQSKLMIQEVTEEMVRLQHKVSK